MFNIKSKFSSLESRCQRQREGKKNLDTSSRWVSAEGGKKGEDIFFPLMNALDIELTYFSLSLSLEQHTRMYGE